jgi:hypothetical protein
MWRTGRAPVRGKTRSGWCLPLTSIRRASPNEEGGLGGGCRSLSYHDLAWSSRLLQACRDVHRISRHQEITSRRVAGGHDFTGVDTHPQQQAFSKERVSGDGLAQCQGGSQRALRVIAVRAWQAEDRHHRVADKLLEGASMIGNDALGVGVGLIHTLTLLPNCQSMYKEGNDLIG